VQALEDDRRSVLELGEDALHVCRPGEGRGPPREILRVRRDLELRSGLREPEAGKAQPARREKPLDVSGGEEVVETALLGPWDDERLLLPVLREEVLARDRVESSS